MQLDGSALKNLEIFQDQSSLYGKGTLFWVLNHTKTAMGRRLLVDWLKNPLTKHDEIIARLDSVEELKEKAHNPDFEAFFKKLASLPDLD